MATRARAATKAEPAERYTHGHQDASAVMAARTAASNAAFCLPYLRPGMRLLDAGCGPGSITVGLAQAVNPGEAVGVDIAEGEVEKARSAGVAAGAVNLRFLTGTVYELPFPDGHFDVVFTHTVLEHVREPGRGLAEMRRVLRKGGIIALRGAVMRSHVWWPEAPVVTKAYELYRKVWTHNGGDPDFGLEQRAMVLEAGFEVLALSASFDREMHEDLGGNVANWFIQPGFIKTATEQGWADEAAIRAIHQGLVDWSRNPLALWFVSSSEVVARKT